MVLNQVNGKRGGTEGAGGVRGVLGGRGRSRGRRGRCMVGRGCEGNLNVEEKEYREERGCEGTPRGGEEERGVYGEEGMRGES